MTGRWIWGLVIVMAAIAVVVWSALQPSTLVDVVQPQEQSLIAYVEEQAITRLPHDYLVSMPISGWLEPIKLREGDAVTASEVVAQLEMLDLEDRVRQVEQRIAVLETELKENRDHRLEEHMLVEANAVVKAIDETVQAAEEQLQGSLAVYEFARTELDRLKALSEQERIAERELSEAKTEYRKTGADYRSDVLELAALKTIAAVSYIGPKFITDYIDRKSFEAERILRQLDEARAARHIDQRNLARARIASPIDGVVLQRHQTRRQFLQAGTPLLTLGRLDDIEVIAEVLTERATRIEPGAEVEVFGDAIAGGSIRGEVLRVYPSGFTKISSLGVEQQRVNVAIGLSERPPRLGVGFRVHVRIVHDRATDALVLPRTCLFRDPDGTHQVLVVESGRIQTQAVTVGLMNDEAAEIKAGLTTNDAVAIHPARELKPGMRVRIR